jgi:hypothetical protein
MIKDRLLTGEEITWLVKTCVYVDNPHDCDSYKKCPLSGECLFFLTGDDSELKGETNESK